MNKVSLLAIAITITLATGSANAGIKDVWTKTKTKLAGTQQTEQAQSQSVSNGQMTNEQRRCDMFFKEMSAGKIPGTPENQATAKQCQTILTTNSSTPAGPAPVATDRAALPPVVVKGQAPAAKPDMGKAATAAGNGCGIGAVIGARFGVDGNLACAVGGAIGLGWSYKKQVKEARLVQEAAQAAGMTAKVNTEQAEGKGGKAEEKLAGVVIDYKPADMQAMDPKTVAFMDRVAGFASKAKNELTFRFEGGAACSIPRDDLVKRGVLAKHKVEDLCGKNGPDRITITPIPDIH